MKEEVVSFRAWAGVWMWAFGDRHFVMAGWPLAWQGLLI